MKKRREPSAAAEVEQTIGGRLVVGTKVILDDEGDSGIVDSALIKLCADAKIDSIPCKYVAAIVYWLLKDPPAARGLNVDAFELMLSQAMANVASDSQHLELGLELKTAQTVASFIRCMQENEETKYSAHAAVFAHLLLSFVSEEEALKIYRPWNENGDQGFKFTNNDFAPFEWNASAPRIVPLATGSDAGGASATTGSSLETQGRLVILSGTRAFCVQLLFDSYFICQISFCFKIFFILLALF